MIAFGLGSFLLLIQQNLPPSPPVVVAPPDTWRDDGTRRKVETHATTPRGSR